MVAKTAARSRIVCVTGMHRSGTSMIARVVQALGVYLGDEERLLPARQDNPEGFFEHAELTEVSEEVLVQLGGSWHDLPRLPAGWELAPALDDLYERARTIVARDFGGRPLWGWKDPRVCLTLPFWQRLLGPIETILCVRNPLDVALSLHARDGFPFNKTLMLWAVYTAAALVQTENSRRVLTWYEDYVDAPQGPAALLEWLAVEGGVSSSDARVAEAARAVRPELRHQASPPDPAKLPEMSWAGRALYATLIDNGLNDTRVGLLAHAVLEDEALRVIVQHRDEQLRNAAPNAERLRRHRDRLRAAARRQRLEFGRIVGDIDVDLGRLSTLIRQIDVDRRAHDALASEIAAVEASATWKLVRALRRLRRMMRTVGMQVKAGRGAAVRRPARPRNLSARPLGVNVAGYLAAESGMGEAVRASIRALEAAGIPVALNNEPGFLREHDQSYSRFDADNPHPINLVHLNADNMEAFSRRRGEAYFKDRYTIGFWFWELEQFRADWRAAFDYVHEVWVATDFTARALRPDAPPDVPVTKLPPAVPPPTAAAVGRDHFGLPADAFVFLFMFDVSSQLQRKNPEAVLRAFRGAALGDRATLVLKYTNSDHDPEAVRRLHALADGLSVRFLDGYLTRAETAALIRCADSYVSLHRAEGFGLTLAEAMALEKPVIATRYAGNLEFMTADNSLLVDYDLVDIDRDYGPYLSGFRWAEPDLVMAARCMREVAQAPDLRHILGLRAARDVGRYLSVDAAAARVRARLEAIRQEAT